MKFSVVAAEELDVGLKACWDLLRDRNETLRSPYFSWQYLESLTSVGRDVRVLVVEDGPEVVAFLAFESQGAHRITAPGDKLTDYHGLICARDTQVSPSDLLRASGSRLLHFDHVPATQQAFAVCAKNGRHVSPAMNLEGGWDTYVARLSKIQGRQVPGIIPRVRQARKAALKQFGSVRLVFHEANHDALERLMALKSQQYQNSQGATDVFAVQWIRQLMHHLLEQQHPNLKGVLSSLYADDTLLASHFGIQSSGLLHAWFPAYAKEHAAVSPGLMMFHDMGVQAQANGVDMLDFGRGQQDYKLRFMTHSTELVEGILARPQWFGNAWMFSKTLNRRIKSRLKSSPMVRKIYRQLQRSQLNH